MAAKTRLRTARHQYVRIDQRNVVDFLVKHVPLCSLSFKIYGGSQASLNRRLEAILSHLDVANTIKPSSFRPGGATHLFQSWGEDLRRLQWRGRWCSERMLEHYVQELQGIQILASLPQRTRTRLRTIADLFDSVLREA